MGPTKRRIPAPTTKNKTATESAASTSAVRLIWCDLMYRPMKEAFHASARVVRAFAGLELLSVVGSRANAFYLLTPPDSLKNRAEAWRGRPNRLSAYGSDLSSR